MHPDEKLPWISYPVQEVAVKRTKQLLSSSLDPSQMPQVHALQCCHSELQQHVPAASARVICFNLGYLPKGDRQITTKQGTTAAAVNAALQVGSYGTL